MHRSTHGILGMFPRHAWRARMPPSRGGFLPHHVSKDQILSIFLILLHIAMLILLIFRRELLYVVTTMLLACDGQLVTIRQQNFRERAIIMQLCPMFASVVGRVSVAALRGSRSSIVSVASPLVSAMDICDQPWVIPARKTSACVIITLSKLILAYG